MSGPATTEALGYAPDRAIRARLRAIVVDGVIVGTSARLLFKPLGVHSVGGALLAFLCWQFVYFFSQEALLGRTIGKSRAGLRIVGIDGTRPNLTQLAIRNALRFFDALPMFYASGLISVMWTGPGRRQRIGDRAASTTVIRDSNAASTLAPGWLLPALTVVAVLLSVVIYGVLYDEYRPPEVSADALVAPVVAGFAGDNSAAPAPGLYSAQPSSGGRPLVGANGQPIATDWHVTQKCTTPSHCSYAISRTIPQLGEESSALTPATDGWHAIFPTHSVKARCPRDGSLTDVLLRSSVVVHFDPQSKGLQAREAEHVRSDSCGEFTVARDWSGSLVQLQGGSTLMTGSTGPSAP